MKKFIIILFFFIILFFLAWFLWSLMLKSNSQEKSFEQNNLVQVEGGDQVQEVNGQRSIVSIDQASSQIKDVYKNDPAFQECTSDVVQSCLSQVIGQKVRDSGDISLCDDFLTDQARESCRVAQSYELARLKLDPSFCEKLDESQKQSCLREVFTAMAIDMRDLAKCDGLNENKEECVRRAVERISSETLDASWCENVAEENREYCIRDVQDRLESARQQEQAQAEFQEESLAAEQTPAEQEELAQEEDLQQPEEDAESVSEEESAPSL